MTGFLVIGLLAAAGGLVILTIAIRHQSEQRPKYTAMLIGGMMLTAFGLVIGGFAIAWQRTGPLALNAAAPTP